MDDKRTRSPAGGHERHDLGEPPAHLEAGPWPFDDPANGPPLELVTNDHAPAPREWPELLEFHRHDLPAFPAEALPPWLRAWVLALATALQVPIDMPAALALGVVSSVGQRSVRVRVRGGWREPIGLFVAIVAAPAERKSGVFAAATEPVRAWERSEAMRMVEPIRSAMARHAVAKRAHDKASDPDRAVELATALAAIVIPVVPRVIADNATTEQLEVLLASHGAIGLLAPEGVGLFNMMSGQYRDTGPNLEVYLKGWSAEPVTVDRVNRAPIRIDEARLSIVTATQPSAILGLAAIKGARGLGLLGRFLFVWPRSIVGTRDERPPAMPDTVREAYDAGIRALLDLGTSTDHELVFSPAARGVQSDRMRWLEPRLGEHGDLYPIADWAGKLAGQVARFAGVLHLAGWVEHSQGGDPWQVEIAATTVESAWGIGDYVLAHASHAFGMMGTDPATELAKAAWSRIEHEGWESFNKRDLYQCVKGRVEFGKADALDAPLAELVRRGYILPMLAGKGARAGRPASPRFEVRPLAKPPHNPHYSGSEDCGEESE